MMVVGNVLAASSWADCVNEKGYLLWEKIKPVAFAGAPYFNMFVAAHETMSVDMPYEGPEAAMGEASNRSYFEDI